LSHPNQQASAQRSGVMIYAAGASGRAHGQIGHPYVYLIDREVS
jgi:hypothetical protein